MASPPSVLASLDALAQPVHVERRLGLSGPEPADVAAVVDCALLEPAGVAEPLRVRLRPVLDNLALALTGEQPGVDEDLGLGVCEPQREPPRGSWSPRVTVG